MIENIKNIGQLLIPANQVVSDKSKDADSRRFSISEAQRQPEKISSEISSADNKSKNVKNDFDNSDIQKNEYSDQTRSNNEAKPKIEKQED